MVDPHRFSDHPAQIATFISTTKLAAFNAGKTSTSGITNECYNSSTRCGFRFDLDLRTVSLCFQHQGFDILNLNTTSRTLAYPVNTRVRAIWKCDYAGLVSSSFTRCLIGSR